MLYWLSLLIVAVKKALFAGHIDDHRSDSDDSDNDQKSSKKEKAH
jgi:hypothetical protein